MRTWAGVIAAAVLAVSGGGVDASPPAVRSQLTVCLAAPRALPGIQRESAAMFAEISVAVTWRPPGAACPADGIEVSILEKTPVAFRPGALGYALPFDGSYVQIFLDRIVARVPEEDVRFLFAHVLVHELTHVAQAISRHSSDGIMKARWDATDLEHISQRSLPFTAHDVELIHRGLAARDARNSIGSRR